MKALEYLRQRELLNIGLIQVLLRGTARIYHEGETGVFLRDTVSNAWMLSAEDTELGICWLREKEGQEYHLMQLCQGEVADFAQEEYGLERRLECRQAVYTKAEAPGMPSGRLSIREARDGDMAVIRANYDKLSEDELELIRKRQELFVGEYDGQLVGFIGCHLEGSMGLLEILPQFRREGFGTELECFLIGQVMKKGLIPFGQIETWNGKSMELQRKIGMELSDEKELVYWLF